MVDQLRTQSTTAIANALHEYNAKEGNCYCGESKGHTGWLLCVDMWSAAGAELARHRNTTREKSSHES